MQNQPLLNGEVIHLLVKSITQDGNKSITELEAERLLNAIARVQAGVPTGTNPDSRRDDERGTTH